MKFTKPNMNDTKHFLNKLKFLRVVKKKVILVTLEVASPYLGLPHENGRNAL